MMFWWAPVPVLLRVSRPATVTGRVWSFVVDAVECKAERLLAHVRKKVLKTVAPTVAYRDAASAPVPVFFNIGVIATRKHIRPRSIGRSPFPACGMAVAKAQRADEPKQQTPARSGVAATQVTGAGSCFSAADASAPPMNNRNARRASMAMRDTKYGQAVELLTCDIVQSGHRTDSNGSRSSGGRTLQGSAVALSVTRTEEREKHGP